MTSGRTLLWIGAFSAVIAAVWHTQVYAQDELPRAWEPQFLGMQATSIWQHLDPFHSPYSGPRSLTSTGDQAETDTYGLYLGAQLTRNLQAYMDFELARGNAPGKAEGLGSLTNGDVVRIGSVDLGEDPYLARAYVQYTLSLSDESETVRRTLGVLPGKVASRRIEFKFGKFALTDDIDLNRYANSTRIQFQSWSLWNNSAWDYAADTRGYTNGFEINWLTPRFDVHFAEVQVVTFANGNVFDDDLNKAHSENLEFAVRTGGWGPVIRVLGYQNTARMGDYAEALRTGAATHSAPDITANEKPGRVKYGYGINLEQPLAAEGETGLYFRYGWNDGATEDFMFTEVDQLSSGGIQLCGCHWGRSSDRAGIAFAIGSLSSIHRAYLAAGGIGFVIGDGQLNYGDEVVTELYYRFQVGTFLQISPDYQYYANPGYNRDRGPAQVYGIRVRIYDM